ncbi:unnamed protein product [Pocillopora meandrina]|uniref:LicD/FKTN/FKRP nucleotidyltransferase domain-containing protein n=1 Tax=Pocillopora meandrina TaxID=46732 RepID=A0AAU9XZ59_9CNID|nr:unnamed protein product [Pocillopora meandrina]
MKVCEEAGLYCELDDGSVLGAVKFGKVLPWGKDADIRFLLENYTAFLTLRSQFEAAGFRFIEVNGPERCADGRKTGERSSLIETIGELSCTA